MTIVPLADPDDLDADSQFQTDMYGTPADAYVADAMNKAKASGSGKTKIKLSSNVGQGIQEKV